MKRYLVSSILCFAGLMSNAWADISITYEALKPYHEELPAGTTTKILLSNDALRIDIGNLYSMILKRDNFFFLIDHKERSFVDVERAIKEMERVKEEMEKQLAQLPPDQREMAKAMMGMKWSIEIPETEICEDPKVIKDEPVNGIPSKAVDGCKIFEEGEWVACRYWFADGKRLGLKEEHYRLFLNLMDFQLKAFSILHQMLGGISLSYQPTERVIKLPYKYPLVVKAALVKDGKEEPYLMLKEVKTEKITEKIFSIPEGYKDATPKMRR